MKQKIGHVIILNNIYINNIHTLYIIHIYDMIILKIIIYLIIKKREKKRHREIEIE